MTFDEEIMKRAISLAKKGKPFAYPNPLVGCVIVKNKKIIGEGYHKVFGQAHAEVNAIKNSTENVKDATLYVTMEPCSTYGKTPPCVDLIIKSKIKKVIIGDLDPNIVNKGKGINILNKNLIKTKVGVLKDECKKLNDSFYKNMIYKMPYITLKFAQSLNGKIANKDGKSKWISCKESRYFSQQLRLEADCILVGVNTILKDNPKLNIRIKDIKKKNSICIIDPSLKTPINSKIFSYNKEVFIVTDENNMNNKKYLNKAILINIKRKNNFFDLKLILKILYQKGVRHILVEGGANTLGQFIYHNLYDRIYAFISPLIIGEKSSLTSIIWPDIFKVKNLGLKVSFNNFKKIGEDILIEIKK